MPSSVQVFHLEDIIEETGFVLEKDSEYCQKFLEEEEEITINVTTKAGGIKKYQVRRKHFKRHLMIISKAQTTIKVLKSCGWHSAFKYIMLEE